MTFYVATKTLAAIDAALVADGGAAYRANLGRVIGMLKDPYRAEVEHEHRSHLGISGLGHECDRKLWYGFHWFPKVRPIPSKGEDPTVNHARSIRLLNRGHLEEARFLALLLTIGCKIYQQDKDGEQFRVSDFGGHLGSAMDGVIEGCPDVPGEPILLEFKTAADKYQCKLTQEGVRLENPVHYVQAQTVMQKAGFRFTLYLSVNKNDDSLHGEIIPHDGHTADHHLARGKAAIFSPRPLPRMHNASPGFWKCRFCDHRQTCYNLPRAPAPERNCRTCPNGEPQPDGAWACRKHGHILDTDAQRAGCPDWSSRL